MLDVEHPGGEVGAGAFDSGFLAQEGGQRHAERTGDGVQRVEGRVSLSSFEFGQRTLADSRFPGEA